jgi:hypothetical protein
MANPLILMKWRKMFHRYYFNWHHGRFDYPGAPARSREGAHLRKEDARFRASFRTKQILLAALAPLLWVLAMLSYPLAGTLNPAMKILLPFIEPVYAAILRITARLAGWLSRRKVSLVAGSDPSLFEV